MFLVNKNGILGNYGRTHATTREHEPRYSQMCQCCYIRIVNIHPVDLRLFFVGIQSTSQCVYRGRYGSFDLYKLQHTTFVGVKQPKTRLFNRYTKQDAARNVELIDIRELIKSNIECLSIC